MQQALHASMFSESNQPWWLRITVALSVIFFTPAEVILLVTETALLDMHALYFILRYAQVVMVRQPVVHQP